MACCGSNGSPFIQTRFLGASIVRFSAQADWNGSGGGLQVELVEDTCNGDAFQPPGLGMPVYFAFGGFTYGGILQNWKQSESATGPLSYTVNCVSPRDIVDGTELILNSYNGPTMGVPNIANVYGWLEAAYGGTCPEAGFSGTIPGFGSNLTYPPAPGFGGAMNNEIGIPWNLIKGALTNIFNGNGGAYGKLITFRDYTYFLDLSELPYLSNDIRIGGENMTLDAMVAHVCGLAGVDYFYDLITNGAVCGSSTPVGIIKVRTNGGKIDESAELVDAACSSQIDARLSLGTIGQTIASSQCINRYGRGLELRMDTTNAFLTGEFRQEVWQIEYEDTSPRCEGHATIWPYWGTNADGSVIIGTQCSGNGFPNEIDDSTFGHSFVTSRAPFPWYRITMYELRAALGGQASWETWLRSAEPGKWSGIDGQTELDMLSDAGRRGHNEEGLEAAFRESDSADEGYFKNEGTVDTSNAGVRRLSTSEDLVQAKITKLYEFVLTYAQEYYGRQFMVRLPFLCRRYNSDTPWTKETNWEPTDSGWTEWSVLGIPQNHWWLDTFRAEDGKVKCFVKFMAETPLNVTHLNKSDYLMPNQYTAFVSGECQKIVWVSPTDARAVVKISGPVEIDNSDYVRPEWLLAFGITTTAGLANSKRQFDDVVKNPGNDKLAMYMNNPFIMPVAAAVPLQSKRLVYGPWFAKKTDVPGFDFFGGGNYFGRSDKGKTIYQRESGFAPWQFGSFAKMDSTAFNTASSMLGEKYVMEMGDVTFPGSPTGSLGSLIAAGGPSVSTIDVQVGRGTGHVTTTYRMRTATSDTGKLNKQRIDQMRHATSIARKAEFLQRKASLERLRGRHDNKMERQLLRNKEMPGLNASSSHSLMVGQAGADVSGPSLRTSSHTERQVGYNWSQTQVVVKSPKEHEQTDQANEPWAKTTATTSELRKELRLMRSDNNHRWRRRAYMETQGMFRPFSTLPHDQKADQDDAYFMSHWRNDAGVDKILPEEGQGAAEDGQTKITEGATGGAGGVGQFLTQNVDFFQHEQVPPIFCKESHLPINITTLSPFLSKGRSLLTPKEGEDAQEGWSNGGVAMSPNPDAGAGHDIEYIARDGVYPTNLSVRHPYDNYSKNHWYRAIALRGPLIIAGWGFDIDNKPVPNESTTYPANPKMSFEQDWLRKPQKWMCGPVDLRWDYKRQVWTAPSPMKIVRLVLDETLCPDGSANAIIYEEQEQYDYDGTAITTDQASGTDKYGYKVKVWSNAMYPVPGGWRIMACFDTTHNRYQMINHDPLPLVEVEIDATIDKGEDGEGTILGPAGGTNDLDPGDVLSDMPIDLTNTLERPLASEEIVYVWIGGFACDTEGDEGPAFRDCNAKGKASTKAYGVVVGIKGDSKQHMFRGQLDVVLTSGGSASMTIFNDAGPTEQNMIVRDWLLNSGQEIAAGTNVIAVIEESSLDYYVTSAACS